MADNSIDRSVGIMACSFRAENFQTRELMGRLELENQVIEGMMGQLRLVHNYNNLLVNQWDLGHIDVGNGWAAAVAWEQE